MAKARKEIDKDTMYQKIMPSSMRTAEEAAPPDAEKKPAVPRPRKSVAAAKATRPMSISARPTAHAPVTRLLEEPGEAAAPPTGLPHTQPRAVPASAPAKPAIVNIMELLIDQKILLAMEKFNCCICEKCKQDICAFALNKLAPRYVVQDDELVAEALGDKEANTQVTTALVQAILKIKANPKH